MKSNKLISLSNAFLSDAKNIMPKYFILFISLLIGSLTCFAKEDRVKVQFVAFPKLNNAEPVELFIGNGEAMRVELPTNCLSPEYEVDRLAEWLLGRSATGTEGEFIFNTYGKIGSLSSSNQLILVVRKGPDNTDGFDLIPMDNDQSGFAGGDYFFMNAAKVDIAVEIGDKVAILKPRTHKLVEPNPTKIEGNRKYLYVYIHFRKGEEAVPFYSNTWRLSERARCMVFLYHDPNTKQLRTHTIRDYL